MDNWTLNLELCVCVLRLKTHHVHRDGINACWPARSAVTIYDEQSSGVDRLTQLVQYCVRDVVTYVCNNVRVHVCMCRFITWSMDLRIWMYGGKSNPNSSLNKLFVKNVWWNDRIIWGELYESYFCQFSWSSSSKILVLLVFIKHKYKWHMYMSNIIIIIQTIIQYIELMYIVPLFF